MALQTFNFWEIALDGAQVLLCCFILFFLIRNKVKYKQLLLKTPPDEKSTDFNARFAVEAIRQQSELAFNRIMETIDKEHKTLSAYFELNETHIAPGLMKSPPIPVVESPASAETTEASDADAIYCEVKRLADQGMSVDNISAKLNVPKGEVDLVLKLKHLSIESAKNKSNPQA